MRTRKDRRRCRVVWALAASLIAACGPSEVEQAVVDTDKDTRRPVYYAVEAPVQAPVRGPRDAPVTIVTFADFQAARAKANSRGLAELVERFAGKVRVVYRANPLPKHPDAGRAELYARAAARQGKFWQLHDLLVTGGKLGEADLLAAAEKAGCDRQRLRADIEDPALAEEIARDRQAALELGVGSVPMNFVNGRPLKAVRFVDDAAPLVAEELARAEQLLRSGRSRSELYPAIVAGGEQQLPGSQRAVRRVLDPEAVYRVPVQDDDPRRGPADALLTVIVFADFECPYSARVRPALDGLLEQLKGQVRLVFKHLPGPSHPTASLAAEAAVEAQVQGRFWELHDLLFDHWRELDRTRLEELGTKAGLDPAALKAALDDRRHAARVERDRQLAARLELHGTPQLFLNGKLVRGSRSLDQLFALAQPAIDAAAAVQRENDGSGSLYQLLTGDGASSPVYLEPGAAAVDPDLVTDGKRRVYDVVVPDDAPALGPDSAPVTVVEFGDYQCGWCRKAYPVLKSLRERFGARVRVVFMHYPIAGHEHARLAAEAAVEAHRQGKFWEYHEKLLGSQGALAEDDLVQHAADLGLDRDQMAAALSERRHRKRVADDMRAARALGVAGTPAFFVNGRQASSTRFEADLPALVEQVLALSGLDRG
jgi:protein-disulfide isomerase